MTNIFTKWFGKKEIESKTFAELDKNAQELIRASLVFTSDKGEALEIDSKGEFVAKEKKRMGRPSNKPYHTLGDIPNPNEGTKKRRGRPSLFQPKLGSGTITHIRTDNDSIAYSIIPVPESILSKEFIMEAECKQFTKLTNKARKKLEDKKQFPLRLVIKAASRKFPVVYGHCYLGKEVRGWYYDADKKQKTSSIKPKLYKDPAPIKAKGRPRKTALNFISSPEISVSSDKYKGK